MTRWLAAALLTIGSASVAAASAEPLVLTGEVTVRCEADEPARVAEAKAALEQFMKLRHRAAQGRWENWYRGDKKVDAPRMLQSLGSERI
ncbi:MAG: hypothetical protein JXQ73_30770 [Phycisphaerae bacterium]|nr:hypothetical protein [Phycisphaerae bacterium]